MPSTWSGQRPTSACPTPFRRRQPRSTLAADTSAEEDPLFTLGLTWVHRASRPASGLLLYQLTTLRPATISGAAAGAHGNVPFGADAVASAALPIGKNSGHVYMTPGGKGLKRSRRGRASRERRDQESPVRRTRRVSLILKISAVQLSG